MTAHDPYRAKTPTAVPAPAVDVAAGPVVVDVDPRAVELTFHDDRALSLPRGLFPADVQVGAEVVLHPIVGDDVGDHLDAIGTVVEVTDDDVRVVPVADAVEAEDDDDDDDPGAPRLVSVPRDVNIVSDGSTVLVPLDLIVAGGDEAHGDVERGDLIRLHDAGADTDEYDATYRVIDVVGPLVHVVPWSENDAGTDSATGSEAEAMTGDGAVKDQAELTSEGAPSGPGALGIEVEGTQVASPEPGAVGPSAPSEAGNGSSAPDDAAGQQGPQQPAVATSYSADDVPEGAAEVVAWIDEGEDRADQVARAGAARLVENGRPESAQRKTVLQAIAVVLDD